MDWRAKIWVFPLIQAILCLARPAHADQTVAPAPPPPISQNQIINIDPAISTVQRNGDKLTVITKDAAGNPVTVVYDLELIPKGTPLFHWTTEGTPDRWMSQGGMIKPDELDWLDSPNTGMQAFGPGWYVSKSPVDSTGFGVAGIVEVVPQDFWMIKAARFSPVDAATAHQSEILLGTQDVIGTQANDTWHTIFNPRAAANLQPINSTLALDALMNTYAPPGTGYRMENDIGTILGVVDLQPHPFFTKFFPELDHLIHGQILTPEELDKIMVDYSSAGVNKTRFERQAYALLNPTQHVDFLKKLVQPKDPLYLQKLLNFEQSVGRIPDSADFLNQYPGIAKLLSGKVLNPSERAAMQKALLASLQSVDISSDAPLLNALRNEFQPEIYSFFSHQSTVSPSNNSILHNQLINQAREWGVPLNFIEPAAKDPGFFLSGETQLSYQEARRSLDVQGKNLLDSFSFMDEGTLLHALATGNKAPWSLYDHPGETPFLQRWNNALGSKKYDTNLLYSRFTGKPLAFRDTPLVLGGKITPPGSQLGYLRVSESQLNVLQNNPLLTVTSIPDPAPPSAAEKSFLVRYEFPSVTTYKKFANLLDPAILNDLKTAEASGALADPLSDSAKALTSRIVQDLLSKNRAQQSFSTYAYHASLRPYPIESDRFARFLAAKESGGAPSFLPSWNDALLYSPSELTVMQADGNRRLTIIANALKKAHDLNPVHPNYDVPELYDTFFSTSAPVGDKANFDAAAKAFFQDPVNAKLIEDKQFTELQWHGWDFLNDQMAKLPPDQRQAILLSWAKANIDPNPSTAARFQFLLDESLKLANGANKPTILRWWLECSSNRNPAYAALLANFIEKLPTNLRKEYQEEWLKSGLQLSVPVSDKFKAEEIAIAKGIYASKATPLAERAQAARFLLQNILESKDVSTGYKNLAQTLPSYLKDPSGDALVAELTQVHDSTERAKFIRACLELPKDSLSNVSRGTVLSAMLNLAPEDQSALIQVAINHPEHWIVSDTWKLLGEANSFHMLTGASAPVVNTPLGKLLTDPSIQSLLQQKLLQDPARLKIWSSMVGSLPTGTDFSQNKLLQNLIDQKAWPAFLGILKQSRTFVPMWSYYGQTGVDLQSIVDAGLQAMANDSPENAAIAHYIRSLLCDPKTSLPNSAELDQMYPALKTANAESRKFILKELYATLEVPAFLPNTTTLTHVISPENTATVLSKITGSGSSETVTEFLDMLKPKALETVKANADLGKSLATNLAGLNDEARLKLADRISRLHAPVSDGFISTILAGSDKPSIATLQSLIQDPNYKGPRWSILSQGLASSDPDVKKGFIAAMLKAGNQTPATDLEIDQMAKLATSLSQNSYAALDAPDFAALSADRKALMRSEFGGSLPNKSREAAPACPTDFAKLSH